MLETGRLAESQQVRHKLGAAAVKQVNEYANAEMAGTGRRIAPGHI